MTNKADGSIISRGLSALRKSPLVAAATQLQNAVNELRAKRSELCEQQSKLHAEIEATYRKPLRAADVKALVLLAIDRWSDEFQSNWTPVLRDFVKPRGKRPLTLESHDAKTQAATARLETARANQRRVEHLLTPPPGPRPLVSKPGDGWNKGHGNASDTWQPTISRDELTSAKAAVDRAERDLKIISSARQLSIDPVETCANALMVQDALSILDGNHNVIFGTADASLLDPHRNIMAGALDASLALDARKNIDRQTKAMCFFFGDAIKAKVEKYFDSAVAADPEAERSLPSLADSQAHIASNQQRIEQLQGEIDAIDNELRQMKSGLNV